MIPSETRGTSESEFSFLYTTSIDCSLVKDVPFKD